MFSKDGTGRPIFIVTLSHKRYEVLISCIRFDNPATRAVNEILFKLIKNSQQAYLVTELLTIDEMIVSFIGKCPFKVYMPNKPKKYDIKIMYLCDSSIVHRGCFQLMRPSFQIKFSIQKILWIARGARL